MCFAAWGLVLSIFPKAGFASGSLPFLSASVSCDFSITRKAREFLPITLRALKKTLDTPPTPLPAPFA